MTTYAYMYTCTYAYHLIKHTKRLHTDVCRSRLSCRKTLEADRFERLQPFGLLSISFLQDALFM